MILSGGNYGGYVVEGTTATLTIKEEIVDTQTITIGEYIVINDHKYTNEGIFCGIIE